jgi:predicted nucleic acid-binding protein
MDARTFRSWARLTHRKPGRLIEDAMVAVTAAVHGLTVVTRNVRDSRISAFPHSILLASGGRLGASAKERRHIVLSA